MRRHLLILALAATVSACTTWDLQSLRTAELKGDAFQSALAKGYLELAEYEAQAYDWADSQHFAGKGLEAAYGNTPEPEQPASWNITDPRRVELEDAHAKLISALNSGARSKAPEAAAAAQVYFDCWVENTEEAVNQDEIDTCRGHFFEKLNQLNNAEPIAAVPQGEPISYTIYFDYDSIRINTEGSKILDGVITQLKQMGAYEVIINGHTDRSGSVTYNLKLGLKRAEAVKTRLVTSGIDEKVISVFSFGETDPKIVTEDGRQERGNRRVEIFLSE